MENQETKENNQELFLSDALNNKSEENDNDVLRKVFISETAWNCLYEIFATFLFVMTICFCNGDVNKFVFGFFVILVLFEKCSGPHLNPCFTIAFTIYFKKFNIRGLIEMFLFILCQVIGAYAGGLLSIAIKTVSKNFPPFVRINDDVSDLSIFFTEFFFTGSFMFVILFVISDVTKPSKNLVTNCGIIICWFYMIVQAGAAISGAAYNPANLIVLNTLTFWLGDKENSKVAMEDVGIMLLAEFTGSIIFTILFKFVYEPFYAFKHKAIIYRNSLKTKDAI